MLVGEPMKWPQPWSSKPPIHLDKSCDLGALHEYERIGTCMDEV
jgi:hypothetical protein